MQRTRRESAPRGHAGGRSEPATGSADAPLDGDALMTRPTLAHHLVALNASADTVPSDIHLLPRGVFKGRDGRGPYRMPDPAKVIAATQAHQKGAKLPVDFDHQLEYQRDGDTVRAAGWIDGLRADDDGLFGRVEWTPAAARMIADREYRYVSPVFLHSRAGDILRLCSVSLTNKPNLDLIALNTERRPMSSPDPQDLLRPLRDQLGLLQDAEPVAVMAALSDALGLSPETAASSAAPDPRQWVPIGEYRRVVQELNAVDNRLSSHMAERYVETLVEGGHLLPFQRDWAVALCRADKDALDTFVAEVAPQTQALFKTLTTPQVTGPARRGDTV
ncbi:hypothetical protein GHC57_18705, partial [Roseospira navarrensis]|nr:hypothetical protein [Roseospira navarrensis]